MRRCVALFLFFVSLNCSAALAPRMYSIILQTGLTAKQITDTAENSVHNNKADINLLYFVRGGPTFGFRYFIESRNEVGSESGESYGPSFGYYWESGFYVLGHYDILAKLGDWANGEGTQLDIGYLEHIGGQFHIGFQISDKRTVYKTSKATNLAEERTVKDKFSSFVLMYLF
ncbi:MAG: hypothetical protein V4654_04805 [Bdellovibrionota bacterium]